MTEELKEIGLNVGHRSVGRLMRQNGISVVRTRKYKATTDSDHKFNIAPNLLDRNFTADLPNQKWAGDISYVWTREGWLYLAVILDLHSRRVIGWAVSNRMKRDLAIRAAVSIHPKGLPHERTQAMSEVTVTTLNARPVLVPLSRPVVVMTGQVTSAPLVLIDLECSDGSVGRTYLFTYTPLALRATAALLRDLAPVIEGSAANPRDLRALLLGRLKLLGAEGLTLMAIAGIDMAAWDALARRMDRPLYDVLGGASKALPTYNSNGMGLIGPTKVADEAKALLSDGGFSGLKVRLGYPDVATDSAVLNEVRDAVGEAITIVMDYNQGLSVAEAKQRISVLAAHNLGWIEEPVAFDDYTGLAELRAISPIPIQGGENHWGPGDMARAIHARALDLVMIDVMKIGGITGWIEASSLAQAAGLPVSSHLFPEASTHLLCADPSAHWLEWVDWASPILDAPYEVINGMVSPPDRPGMGLDWNEGEVARYLAI